MRPPAPLRLGTQDLEAAGAKVLGGDSAKSKRVEDLRNDVAKLQCSLVAARAEYERIREVNKQVCVCVGGGAGASDGGREGGGKAQQRHERHQQAGGCVGGLAPATGGVGVEAPLSKEASGTSTSRCVWVWAGWRQRQSTER